MLAKSSLKDAPSGDRRTNVVLGGLTAALVSWLKIPNEIDGTLDLDDFEFNDEEQDYLEALQQTLDKWERYLLIHGSDTADNHSQATARGRRAQKITNKMLLRKAAAVSKSSKRIKDPAEQVRRAGLPVCYT